MTGKLLQLGLIVWLSFCIFFGALVFSKGFLLNRQIISKKSQSCHTTLPFNESSVNGSGLESMVDWCRTKDLHARPAQHHPVFTKAILILVDALRYDFIPKMTFLSQLLFQLNSTRKNSHAQHFRFLADPPTTTMQRLKALMTGTMPTFIDASANFNSYEVEEDNYIFQLYEAGKRIAFLGDDTWLSLFPKRLFTSPFVEAHPSFNAWDLDTVDRAVNASLHRLLQPSEQTRWDVLIAHFLGVDHCGHRYGPSHPEMARKLKEVDDSLEFIYKAMSRDTLLVVFGDHGMTKTGDHGGDSIDETESGLVFLTKTKKAFYPSLTNPLYVSQIDLVSTLSAIAQIPIPFSSIGQIIPNVLDPEFYSDALAANVAQVFRYFEHYSNMSNLNQQDKALLQDAYKNTEKAFAQRTTKSGRSKFNEMAKLYLRLVKDVALNTWTQFDFIYIFIGIISCLMSLVALTSFLASDGQAITSISTLCVVSSAISPLIASWFLIGADKPHTLTIVCLLILSVTGFFAFTKPSFEVFSKPAAVDFGLPEFSQLVTITAYVISCFAVFSNSFIINEGYVLASMLLLTAFIQVLTRRPFLTFGGVETTMLPAKVRTSVYKDLWISFFVLGLVVRMGVFFFRCREELVDCQEEFLLHKHLPSLPADWAVHKYVRFLEALLSLAVLVVIFRHHMMSRVCISSSRPASIISKYIPSVLVVLISVYWALQGLPFGVQIANSRFLNYFPSAFQSVTIISLIIVWIQPLCCIGRVRGHSTTNVIQISAPVEINKSPQSKKSRKNNSFAKNSTSRLPNSNFARVRLRNSESHNESRYQNHQSDFEHRLENGNGFVAPQQSDTLSEDVFSSPILVNGMLVTLLSVQISSAGVTPMITAIPYAIICLINIFGDCSHQRFGSWSTTVAWTLASQYFSFATGHQPVFATIPWDSAFIGKSESVAGDDWWSFIRPALAVLGNMHVSQLIFSVSLPLIAYWKSEGLGAPETLMGKREIQEAYSIGGKFVLLHGLKLFACICCAALHRRHLMVWKIFAPKFMFEGISFLIVLIAVPGTLMFITRLDYLFRNALAHEKRVIERLSNIQS